MTVQKRAHDHPGDGSVTIQKGLPTVVSAIDVSKCIRGSLFKPYSTIAPVPPCSRLASYEDEMGSSSTHFHRQYTSDFQDDMCEESVQLDFMGSDLSFGAVHPDNSPVNLTPIIFGAFSSHGRLAILRKVSYLPGSRVGDSDTSTASAPPTPMATMLFHVSPHDIYWERK